MIKPFRILLTCLIIFLASSLHTTLAAKIQRNTVSDAQIQQDILHYINAYRAQHGLTALQMNPLISAEATQHSRDMATHAIPFGHKYFPSRIKHLYAQIPDCRAGAENVAFNYKDTKELVRLWQQSPGHRRNIYGHYNLTGIGVARDKNGKIYYTQMFLRTETTKKPVQSAKR